MKAGTICAIILITAICISGCSASEGTMLQDLHIFAETELPAASLTTLYYGDVTGNSEPEIVLIAEKRIAVHDLNLKLLRELTTEEDQYGRAIIADSDDDGKEDIIIGGFNEKNIRLLAFTGLLEPIFDIRYSELHNAATVPCFINDGLIYFTAASELDIPPKIAGALDPFDEVVAWEYFTWPVPIEITSNSDASLFTVSNYPKNAAAVTVPEKIVSDHDRSRGALYLIDKNGRPLLQKSLGGEFSTNDRNENTISSVVQRIADLDGDGTEELIAGISHLSEFYPGVAAIEVYSREGRLLGRREFSPNTEIEFAVSEDADGPGIAVLLRQKGGFYLLDSELEIRHKTDIPNFAGEAKLQDCGDFDGDGRTEYLLTDYNMLYVLDAELETVYSTAESAAIRQAGFIRTGGKKTVLFTLSDKLRLYRPSLSDAGGTGSLSVYTDPPGAEIYINGEVFDSLPPSGVIKNLPTGPVVLEAKLGKYSSDRLEINIEAGHHSTAELTLKGYKEGREPPVDGQWKIRLQKPPAVPLSSFEDFHLVSKSAKDPDERLFRSEARDFAGDGEKDLLFYNIKTGEVIIRSTEMARLTGFPAPFSYVLTAYGDTPDTDGNGKCDILVNNRKEQNLYIFSADGKPLQYSRPLRQKGASFATETFLKNDTLVLSLRTGYALQPRGLLGYNIREDETAFFTPIAGIPSDGICDAGEYFITSYYTTCNGGTLKLPNGEFADDSNYYVHILDKNGRMMPQSFNPGLKYNTGHLFFNSIDTDLDGKDEVYMVTNKGPYYKGPCEIYRVDPVEGSISGLLFSAGKDEHLRILGQSLLGGDPVLIAALVASETLFVLSSDFGIIAELKTPPGFSLHPQNSFFPDLDADGNMEIILKDNGKAVIFDHNMLPLATFDTAGSGGLLCNIILDDTNLDGKPELILVTENFVAVYGY